MTPSFAGRLGTVAAVCLGLGYLLPYFSGPIVTFQMEWIAALGWLIFAGLTMSSVSVDFRWPSTKAALLLLSLPASLALYAIVDLLVGRASTWQSVVLFLGCLLAASACAWVGFLLIAQHDRPDGRPSQAIAKITLRWIVVALLMSALISGCLGFIQYLLRPIPSWLADVVLPPTARPFGNLRQPNLYSLQLTLGLVALTAVAFFAPGSKRDKNLYVLGAMFLGAASALSSSRTGAVMLWAIALFAAIGPVLGAIARWLPAIAAVTHGLAWWIYLKLDALGWLSYFAVMRPVLGPATTDNKAFNDISGMRFDIWRGVWEVVLQQGAWGAGFGNMNYAYFSHEMSIRMGLNIQNAHNLILQLMIEQGPVFAVCWVMALVMLFWLSRSAWNRPVGRVLFLALAAFAIHSELELPLWYLYFLLPAGFALGAYVAAGSVPGDLQIRSPGIHERQQVWGLLGIALAALAFTIWDYQKIVPVFRGGGDVMKKLERGYTSVLFSNYVDYAVATITPVTRENAALHQRQSLKVLRTRIDPSLLVNLALSSAMLGKLDDSAFYLRRMREISPADYAAIVGRLYPDELTLLAPAIERANRPPSVGR